MFLVSILLLGLFTICLPLILQFIPSLKLYPAQAWLPIVAGVCMIVSGFLPDIHISPETNTFQQHFVGGGIYCACLYLYATQLFRWRFHWIINLIFLFA